MKFVTLVIAAMIVSASASAQTTHRSAKKTAVHKQQKARSQKVKPSSAKSATDNNDGIITLTDEKAHKAKWTFDEMLKRRLEIDAEKSVTQQGRE